MIKGIDTLTGYFRFSPYISESGQTVEYKDRLNSYDIEKFQSNKYDYFEADSLYLETFHIRPTLTRSAKAMIPRLINGKVQLFALTMDGTGLFNSTTNTLFFIKKGEEKFQVTKSQFKRQMHDIIGDPELLQRIDNNELKYIDLPQIISQYNSYLQ
jgi:hypothetical protein